MHFQDTIKIISIKGIKQQFTPYQEYFYYLNIFPYIVIW